MKKDNAKNLPFPSTVIQPPKPQKSIDMNTEDLHAELQKITDMLQAMNDEEKAHKEAFGNLYKQLESYKSDFAQKLKNQLLREMLTYFDSLTWYQGMIEEKLQHIHPTTDTPSEENDPIDILENTQYLVEEFLEILRRNEVVAMPNATQFNGSFHRAVQVLESNKEEDEGKIAKIIRKGFYLGSQILRIEDVIVYRYVPAEQLENSNIQQDSIQQDSIQQETDKHTQKQDNEEQDNEEQDNEEQEPLNIQLPISEE